MWTEWFLKTEYTNLFASTSKRARAMHVLSYVIKTYIVIFCHVFYRAIYGWEVWERLKHTIHTYIKFTITELVVKILKN